MTQTDSDMHLEVTKVGRDGKRRYSQEAKARLVQACLEPGVSVSGLALQAGVNANLLRRWIMLHRQNHGGRLIGADALNARALPETPFVQVLEGRRHGVVSSADAPMPRAPSALTVHMPNGITLKLDCSSGDSSLVSTLIETLSRCHVSTGR